MFGLFDSARIDYQLRHVRSACVCMVRSDQLAAPSEIEFQVGEMEASSGATVHGVMTELSPSRSVGEIQT